jgi:hypothetical protein
MKEERDDFISLEKDYSSIQAQVSSEKNNLTKILLGIYAEIEIALRLYGSDDRCLTKVYWPRAFRSLISTILKVSVLQRPELWAELSTLNFTIDYEQLSRLIDELQFSTSTYIRVKHRQWIVHLLEEVWASRKIFRLEIRLPSYCDESSRWPNDLEDKDDLLDSLRNMNLRDDVKYFILNIIDEVIP